MRSGRLNTRLIVEKPVRVQGSAGQMDTSWAFHMLLNSGVEPVKGFEGNGTDQILAGVHVLIVARWSLASAAIDSTYRLRLVGRYRDLIYSIIGDPVNVKTQNHEIQFNCVVGVNRGQ